MHRFSRSVVPTSKKVKDQVFAFDRVFDDNTTQTDVYEGTTKALLDSVLDGYNATVFAYGATGCGKTHTITGTSQHPGIIFLTMQELFEKIEERSADKTTELSLSYLEIYNETIRDLLVPGGSKQGLMLREDSNQAVTVPGLTSHHPRDVQEVMDMIVQGNEYRTVSPTEANATSSRSHAVLQVNIAQKDRNADVSEPHTMATLSIIDLAGSERASVTKNRGERLTEGANINKSLLALGSCINALCDRRQRAHVPYRNSKLTRLLKFSLGGNCKTVMIVCVSPSSAHFDETQNTLRYANRAKNIQTKVTRNVFNVNRHVKDFLVKIDEQMALINELKAQQKDAEAVFLARFRRQGEKREAVAREGVERLRAAYGNSAAERHEHVGAMKKLRAVERRIDTLSGWVAAFDAVCAQRGDGAAATMPQSLAAVGKTARGALLELESSRRHMEQRLERAAWERALDTALTHSLGQLDAAGGADAGERASLAREAELLKANFEREACREVLEQDRAGDAAAVQMLLTAQLDMVASLADTLAMDEEAAVAHAKGIIHRLLQTGHAAAAQVVQPEAAAPAAPALEAFAPSRRGTPRRKKAAAPAFVQPVAPPPALAAVVAHEHVFASPMKSSPRRRRVLGGAKKGVCFTPAAKGKRGVRWRDDESEDGTLADFARTPQKYESPDKASLDEPSPDGPTPTEPAAVSVPVVVVPAHLADEPEDRRRDSSPSGSEAPETRGAAQQRPSRFQAGFLSKASRIPSQTSSPSSPAAAAQTTSPLRTLDAAKAGNVSPPPPTAGGGGPRARLSPRLPRPAVMDENTPLPRMPETGSDSECSIIDARKLRNAMHSAKKDKTRRLSTLSGAAAGAGAGARRVSSVSSSGPAARPGMPAAALASSANGISRHHRSSLERRKSPPLACSPTDLRAERSLTPGQARRMNMGGSVRLDKAARLASSSPEDRRVTYSVGQPGPGPALRRQESRGAGWR